MTYQYEITEEEIELLGNLLVQSVVEIQKTGGIVPLHTQLLDKLVGGRERQILKERAGPKPALETT